MKLKPTPVQIVVNRYFGITQEQLCGGNRVKSVVLARHCAQYLERERGVPFSAIGTWYNRDHSTILLAHRHVSERLKANDSFYVEPITELKRLLVIYIQEHSVEKERQQVTTCHACGISVGELLEQIRNIHRRLDGMGVKP